MRLRISRKEEAQIMKTRSLTAALSACLLLVAAPAKSEILAMMNYESKTPESLKTLKLAGPQERKEGIAIVDVDPESPAFGRILMDIPVPPDQMMHHIFYDRTMTKAYITSLANPPLQVMNLERFPYRIQTIDVPGCVMGEDVILDEKNERWFLTCMGSANVFVGSVETDEVIAEIKLPGTYPHGLGVNDASNRILVTSTVSGDLKTPDEIVSVVDATTYEVLGQIRLSEKPEGSGEAPVEILFAPGASPPVAYVTNMFGGTLWTLTWNEANQDFDAAQVFDFNPLEAGIALEMYFNDAMDRLYVTTAVPGALHIFDLGKGVGQPELLKTIPAGGGAHHVAITKDERYGFVQNALLNLPKMNDGSVTVIDLKKGEAVASMDTLKNAGFNPNSIVLLPEWNSFAGH
jgi:DNA-binding beta-propeller fold protein YncE